MYLSARAAFVRNLIVSIFNGGVTLVILLIAPLGLAAVIFNTLLVMASTLVLTTAGDRVLAFLQAGQPPVDTLPGRSSELRRRP
ncbi:MAG: CRISPR-associated protein Csx18 [Nodosilinea sp.]